MANPNIKDFGKATQFKKGESGNPGGKPEGARNELSAAFLKALAKDFNENGEAALINLRTEKPEVYVKVIADLLPKQEEKKVNVEHTGTIEHRSVSEISQRVTDLLGAGAAGDSTPSVPH